MPTLTFYSDPGHGWLKVPRSLVTRLAVEVTPFSYQRGDYVYLEEDLDAGALVKAARAAGMTVTFNPQHTNRRSRIRSYAPYTAEKN
jgi:hypothetical protein